MRFSLDEISAALNELRWINITDKQNVQVELKLVSAAISEDGISVETLILETFREDDASTDKVVVEIFPVETGMEPILTHVSQKRKVRVLSKKT